MDKPTLLAITDFSHARLLGTLDAIEKNAVDLKRAMGWRIAPGRTHIAWQGMHCAATHDKYLNVRLRGAEVADASLCDRFAGGSFASDDDVPELATIHAALGKTFDAYRAFIVQADDVELARATTLPNGQTRTVAESIVLLAWHEAHHQGQIHLMWNAYQATHAKA